LINAVFQRRRKVVTSGNDLALPKAKQAMRAFAQLPEFEIALGRKLIFDRNGSKAGLSRRDI
jgi:hypothetical protein